MAEEPVSYCACGAIITQDICPRCGKSTVVKKPKK